MKLAWGGRGRRWGLASAALDGGLAPFYKIREICAGRGFWGIMCGTKGQGRLSWIQAHHRT